MNTTLSEVLMKSCIGPAPLSDRLALEHMMLVAILHHRVGQEVGKYCVKYKAKTNIFPHLNFSMLHAQSYDTMSCKSSHNKGIVVIIKMIFFFFRCSCCSESC